MRTRRSRVPSTSPTLRAARRNARRALAAGDLPEFERLALDVAGLINRVDELDQVKAELSRRRAA